MKEVTPNEQVLKEVRKLIKQGVYFAAPKRVNASQDMYGQARPRADIHYTKSSQRAAHQIDAVQSARTVHSGMDHYKSLASITAVHHLATRHEKDLPMVIEALQEELRIEITLRPKIKKFRGLSSDRRDRKRLARLAFYLEGCAIASQYLCDTKFNAALETTPGEEKTLLADGIKLCARQAAQARGAAFDARTKAMDYLNAERGATRPEGAVGVPATALPLLKAA